MMNGCRAAGAESRKNSAPALSTKPPGLSLRFSSTWPNVTGLALVASAVTASAVKAGFVDGHVRLPAGAMGTATLLLTKLLTWNVSGTLHPVGTFAGKVKTIWSSPMQHPDRP